MKILAVVPPLVAAFALAALAGEVPLSPRELDLQSARIVEGDTVCWERAARPEKVTAPDGELHWARLHAGTRGYWACYAPAGDGALYVDADGDLDLKEEKPILPTSAAPGHPVFVLSGIRGEFPSGEGTVPATVTLHYDPSFSEETGILPVATVYEGKAAADGAEVLVSWAPGDVPCFAVPLKVLEPVPARTLYSGDRRFTLGNSLAARDGRLSATFETAKVEGMVTAAAPADAACAVLMDRGEGAPVGTVLLPSGGQFFFPRGEPREGMLVLRKADASGKFFEALVQLGAVNPGDGFSLGATVPLSYTVDVVRDGSSMRFRFACRDAAGREVLLCRDGAPLELPALEILGPDGAGVAKHQFEAG